MHCRYRIYLGHEIKGTTRTVDVAQATEIVARDFPSGFTTYDAKGRWVGPDGRIVSEPTTVFEILDHEGKASRVRDLAARLKIVFGQDSVLVTGETLPIVDFI